VVGRDVSAGAFVGGARTRLASRAELEACRQAVEGLRSGPVRQSAARSPSRPKQASWRPTAPPRPAPPRLAQPAPPCPATHHAARAALCPACNRAEGRVFPGAGAAAREHGSWGQGVRGWSEGWANVSGHLTRWLPGGPLPSRGGGWEGPAKQRALRAPRRQPPRGNPSRAAPCRAGALGLWMGPVRAGRGATRGGAPPGARRVKCSPARTADASASAAGSAMAGADRYSDCQGHTRGGGGGAAAVGDNKGAHTAPAD
jgi:hypothetical protein